MTKREQKRAPRRLTVILEYDKNIPEEERKRRIEEAFKIVLWKIF